LRREPISESGPLESAPLHAGLRRTGLTHGRTGGSRCIARRARRRLQLPAVPARLLLRAGILRQTVLALTGLAQLTGLALLARLTRGIVAQIIPVRIGPPQRALLGDDPAADILRRVNLAHDALIAQSLLR
jgi:hypothetical protein